MPGQNGGRSHRLGGAADLAALRVVAEQALSTALGAAVKSRRTTVLGVRIDASGYVAQFNALREL